MSNIEFETDDLSESNENQITVQVRNESDDEEKTDKVSTKDLQIYFVDVGQGNCTLILCPGGEKILIDCGSVSASSKETVGKPLLEFIGKHAADKLDYVLVSHPDIDHVSLLPSLLDEVKTIGTVLCGGEFAEWGKGPGTAFKKYVTDTLKLDFKSCLINKGGFETESPSDTPKYVEVSGGVEIRIVAVNAPQAKSKEDLKKLDIEESSLLKKGTATNTHSMVVSVRYGGRQVMICGDATFSTDLAILETTKWAEKDLQSYALAGGHHGSEHSYSPRWLTVVDPEWMFLGADMINKSFLHPRQIVIERILDCCPRIRKSHFGPHGIIFGRSRMENPEDFKGDLGPCAKMLTFITNLKEKLEGKNEKARWRAALHLFLQAALKPSLAFSLLVKEAQHWLTEGIEFRLRAKNGIETIDTLVMSALNSKENADDDPPDILDAFQDDRSSLSYDDCELLWWLNYWALQLRRIEKEQKKVEDLNFPTFKEARKLKDEKSKSKSKEKKIVEDDEENDDDVVEETIVESSDVNYWEWQLTDYNLFTSLETANQGVYWLLEIDAKGNCRTHRT